MIRLPVERLAAVAGTAALVVGIVVIKTGKWLLSFDPTDLECDYCGKWETTTSDGGDNVHVIPLRDQVAHTDTDDCPCGPRTEPVFRPDGSNGWVHTHHSLDNREGNE